MIATILAVGGVAIVLACAIAVAWIRAEPAALHYIGPASTVGAAAVALGAALSAASVSEAIVIVFTLAILVVLAPVVTHATGRASRVRRRGDLSFGPDEGRRT